MWDDLVLPAPSVAQLRELSSHITHRGLGTGALFAGPSGTGKTLAAVLEDREAVSGSRRVRLVTIRRRR